MSEFDWLVQKMASETTASYRDLYVMLATKAAELLESGYDEAQVLQKLQENGR